MSSARSYFLHILAVAVLGAVLSGQCLCADTGFLQEAAPVSNAVSVDAEDLLADYAETGILPARYDSREAGRKPTVKSQGKLGTCWALTAASALECALLPDSSVEFSADHMSLQSGFVIGQNEGGDYRMIMAYLSGWYGPVKESEDPYGDGKTQEGLRESLHVKEMRLLEGESPDTFKEMILRCGSVQSSLYMSRRTTSAALPYYNEETCAYRYTKKAKPDHDVLILGWDDDYPRENFREEPEKNGAWICLNTWGEDFGEDGIFYVSYEDTVLAATGLAYTLTEPAAEGEQIFQTDRCGWQGRIGYGREDCSFANVFQTDTDRELTGVGFYSLGEHSEYEVYLVHDFEDTGSFIYKRTVARGECDGKGFFSAVFEEPRLLRAGERFAVIVSIHTEGAAKPVAVELKKDSYTADVTFEGKEGYISPYGGEWENVEKGYHANVCLKAYTRLPEADGSEKESGGS